MDNNQEPKQKQSKRILFLSSEQWGYVFIGIIICSFYLLLKNIGLVHKYLSGAFNIISPAISGAALAYLLNLLMDPLERNLFGKIKKPSLRRGLAMLLTVIIVLLIVAGLIYMLAPQLMTSISKLYLNLEDYMNAAYDQAYKLAARFNIDQETVESLIGSWDKIFDSVSSWLRNALPKLISYSRQVGSSFVKTIISFFVALYVLADRDNIIRRLKYTLIAFLPSQTYKKLAYYIKKSDAAFGGFIKGKLIDSLIIAIITLIFTLIFNIPYAVLISTIVGITNIIPTIGPLIGTIPCAFILLLISPLKALTFVIFILILQQIDGNYIGPRILSNSVGISPLWILIAVFVGGELWGLTGMIIGVPLFSVLLDIAREIVEKMLNRKGITIEDGKEEQRIQTALKEKGKK